MTEKLLPVKPYCPEWKGPFCTRDGRPVEIKFTDGRGDFNIVGYISGEFLLYSWNNRGEYILGDHSPRDLFCAEVTREPREFWFNEYPGKKFGGIIYLSEEAAKETAGPCVLRTIRVREVLPDQGA